VAYGIKPGGEIVHLLPHALPGRLTRLPLPDTLLHFHDTVASVHDAEASKRHVCRAETWFAVATQLEAPT
jgi:hypothetical protein